jgi:hypothetical protein
LIDFDETVSERRTFQKKAQSLLKARFPIFPDNALAVSHFPFLLSIFTGPSRLQRGLVDCLFGYRVSQNNIPIGSTGEASSMAVLARDITLPWMNSRMPRCLRSLNNFLILHSALDIEAPCSKLQSAYGGFDCKEIDNSWIRSLNPAAPLHGIYDKLRGMCSLLRFNTEPVQS